MYHLHAQFLGTLSLAVLFGTAGLCAAAEKNPEKKLPARVVELLEHLKRHEIPSSYAGHLAATPQSSQEALELFLESCPELYRGISVTIIPTPQAILLKPDESPTMRSHGYASEDFVKVAENKKYLHFFPKDWRRTELPFWGLTIEKESREWYCWSLLGG